MSRPQLRPPNPYLVVTVLSWGFNFVALKLVYREMTAQTVSLVRYFTMVVLLVALCLVRGESLKYPKGKAVPILLMGFVSMGAYMVLFLEGMNGTSAAEGAIVLATAPIFTFLFACVLRQESFKPLALVGSVVAFCGVSVVILGGAAAGHGTVGGNLTVLLSAVVWAISVVMTRPLLVDISPLRLLTLSMPGALPALLPYGLRSALTADYGSVSLYAWGMFAHVAVLSGVLAFACFYKGVRQVGPSEATMYQFFTPICAALFAWAVMGQALNGAQWVGMAVVIGGVALAAKARMA